jgi:XapX domain-containing protein
MKALLISFMVGLVVGVVYGVIRVKSPAPPIVALLGLLGMVLGEQAGGWFLTKKIQAANVASAHIVGEAKDQQQRPNVQSRISAVDRGGQPMDSQHRYVPTPCRVLVAIVLPLTGLGAISQALAARTAARAPITGASFAGAEGGRVRTRKAHPAPFGKCGSAAATKLELDG